MPYKSSKKELAYQRKWYRKNRAKKYAIHRKWAIKNKEKVRDYLLQKEHGISLEFYNKILELQGSVCAICSGENDGKNLVVDHDHKTGKLRGLLCFKCNVALGLLKDDFVLFFVAHEYLQRNAINYDK